MATPFDPEDPVNTPNTRRPEGPLLEALGRAVLALQAAGAESDVRLDQIQFDQKDGEAIPILGGQDFEGVIAIATHSSGNAARLAVEPRAPVVNDTTDLTTEGYQINYGNSFVMPWTWAPPAPPARPS